MVTNKYQAIDVVIHVHFFTIKKITYMLMLKNAFTIESIYNPSFLSYFSLTKAMILDWMVPFLNAWYLLRSVLEIKPKWNAIISLEIVLEMLLKVAFFRMTFYKLVMSIFSTNYPEPCNLNVIYLIIMEMPSLKLRFLNQA